MRCLTSLSVAAAAIGVLAVTLLFPPHGHSFADRIGASPVATPTVFRPPALVPAGLLPASVVVGEFNNDNVTVQVVCRVPGRVVESVGCGAG